MEIVTEHRGNILSLSFLGEDESAVVSVGHLGGVILHEQVDEGSGKWVSKDVFGDGLGMEEGLFQFRPIVYKVVGEEDGWFVSNGNGIVLHVDRRTRLRTSVFNVRNCPYRKKFVKRNERALDKSVYGLAVNPRDRNLVATGGNDPHVRIWDRRMAKCPVRWFAPWDVFDYSSEKGWDVMNNSITSVNFSPDGMELLAFYSGMGIYSFDVFPSKQESVIPKPTTSIPKREKYHSQLAPQCHFPWMTDAKEQQQQQQQNGAASAGSTTSSNTSLPFEMSDKFKIHLRYYDELREIDPALITALYNEEVPDREDNAEEEETDDNDDADNSERNSAKRRYLINEEDTMQNPLADDSARASPYYKNFYDGAVNVETIKECSYFGGSDYNYVVSGSDGGTIYIWDRHTAEVLQVLKRADSGCVNIVVGHPRDDLLMASSGFDSDIKLWSPCGARKGAFAQTTGTSRRARS